MRCNLHNDCRLGEDEMDCCNYTLYLKRRTVSIQFNCLLVALSDGEQVNLDPNFKPALEYRGYLTGNTFGQWEVLCGDVIGSASKDAETAGQMCVLLGFKGYRTFNRTRLVTSELHTNQTPVQPRRTRSIYIHMPSVKESEALQIEAEEKKSESQARAAQQKNKVVFEDFEEVLGNPSDACNALYIECVLHASDPSTPEPDENPPKTHLQPIKNSTTFVGGDETRLLPTNIMTFPWIAEIFVNGHAVGFGILLNNYWVLTTSNCIDHVK